MSADETSDETPAPPPPEGEQDAGVEPGTEVVVADEDDERLTQIIHELEGDGDRPVERGELGQILRAVQISERHSGPLPHARMLREYDQIIPNGAERIMKMAELEQQHRHTMESREQTLMETAEGHDFTITKRGQNYGLFICIGVLVIALILAAMGQTGLAGILVGLDLVALASVFVAGRYLPGRAQKPTDDDESDES